MDLANCRTAASLPAINSLLDAIGDTPTKVFLESAHDDDRELPGGKAEVTWVVRKKAGEALVEAVGASAFDAVDHFGWVACDKISRKSIKAQAYWVA
ncbi:MAG: hypothetical protein QOI25_4991 [Mycobacterium sp.]|nr:hypothetical protein [Mycobacterium sp.]